MIATAELKRKFRLVLIIITALMLQNLINFLSIFEIELFEDKPCTNKASYSKDYSFCKIMIIKKSMPRAEFL